MQATAAGKLKDTPVEWVDGAACCVVVASGGYPVSYKKGYPITLPDEIAPDVYVAGAAEKDGQLVTSGGRVLGVTAIGKTLKEAIDKAYEKTAKVGFENAFYRKDVGARALAAKKD